LRRSHSSVPIADENSPSALKSRSFSNPRGILTNLNVAPNVVGHERQNVPEMLATAIHPHARCSRQYAPVVGKKLKYLSNHAKADRCIVVIAIAK
jgi:hypothetical protein